MKNNGPSIRLELSCFDCTYCVTEHYTCQGDSGSDKYCTHETYKDLKDSRKYIGISFGTPEDCPLRKDKIKEFINTL